MDTVRKHRSEMTRDELVLDAYECILGGKNGRLMDHIEYDPTLASAAVDHAPFGKQPLLNVWAMQSALPDRAGNFDAGFILMHHLKIPVDSVRDEQGNGPMHYAALNGKLTYMSSINHHGGSFTVTNKAGKTPAMLAEENGKLNDLKEAAGYIHTNHPSAYSQQLIDLLESSATTPVASAVGLKEVKNVATAAEKADKQTEV